MKPVVVQLIGTKLGEVIFHVMLPAGVYEVPSTATVSVVVPPKFATSYEMGLTGFTKTGVRVLIPTVS